MIARQLLRLIDTVYRPPGIDDDDLDYAAPKQLMATFAAAIQPVRGLKIRWDSQASCYVRGDGSTLAPLIKPVYQRVILDPHFGKDAQYTVKVIVERLSAKRIDITLDVHDLKGTAPSFQLRAVREGQPETVLVDDSEPRTMSAKGTEGKSSWSSTGYWRELPAGQRIRIEVNGGDRPFVSSGIRP
jgi:hypothetical protein